MRHTGFTSRPLLRAVAAAAFVAAAGAAWAAPFEVTFEAPGVQSANRSALCETPGGGCTVGVETFDARPTGAGRAFTTDYGTGGVIAGTYGDVRVARAGVSGGAGGGGNYAVTYTPGGYTLSLATTLPGGVNYFGYWLSALDRGNQVTFYDGAAEIYRFTPDDLIARVGACPDDANAYCGNPAPPFRRLNGREPYAFVNFFARGNTFDRIAFAENPPVGGYESDNHTVGYVTGGSGTALNPVPEPASIAPLGFGLAVLGLLRLTGLMRSGAGSSGPSGRGRCGHGCYSGCR